MQVSELPRRDSKCQEDVTSRPYDPTQRYVLGIDLGRKVDASVVVVAHREVDRVVVDHVERWLPTKLRPVRLETVEAAIRRLHEEYGSAHIRMDPAKGEQMSQALRETGLPVEEYTCSETSIDRLASGLARLFGERRITVPDLTDLREELATVILKTTPSGRTRIDRHSGRHDDQAVGISLAAHWLMAQSFWGKASVNNSKSLARTTIKRDTRTLPVGAARGQVNRQDAAAHRLALMVRARRR